MCASCLFELVLARPIAQSVKPYQAELNGLLLCCGQLPLLCRRHAQLVNVAPRAEQREDSGDSRPAQAAAGYALTLFHKSLHMFAKPFEEKKKGSNRSLLIVLPSLLLPEGRCCC